MYKNNLLLHTCCVPCLLYVYEILKPSFQIISFFYNPNIVPASEYQKRFKELERFCNVRNIEHKIGRYDIKRWTASVKQYRFYGERSLRCYRCYEIRLRETFEVARRNNIGKITTTLSLSPHKDANMINSIGKEFEQKYGIEFIESDFKKRDGFKESARLSKEYGIYRQNYCGCIYSKLERDKNSLWYKKHIKKVL